MSGQGEDAVSGAGGDVRGLISLFGSDRPAALTLLRRLVQEREPPGMILQHLNRFGRPDIVTAFTEGQSFNDKTPDLIVLEHARALAAGGAPQQGRALLDSIAALRPRDYNFQYAAGRLLSELRMHEQALQYYDAAFRIRPSAQVAERVFATRVALEQYPHAAAAMGLLLRTGTFRPGLGKEFANVLEHIEPGELDPELAFTLATMRIPESAITRALLPHLVAADQMDSVIAVAAEAEKAGGLDESALAAVIPYLARRGQIAPLLRLHDKYGAASPAVSACFKEALSALPPKQMTQFLSPQTNGFLDDKAGRDAQDYQDAAHQFGETAEAESALTMVRLLPAVIQAGRAEAFYAQEKTRLDRLVAFVVERLGLRDDVQEALTGFLYFWIRPAVRGFFSGPEFADLRDTAASAKMLEDAPARSRPALFREGYFAHYVEQHHRVTPDEIVGDFQFCEAALSYFSALARQRPVATVPVGTALYARVGRPVLSMGMGRPVDTLASYGLLQNRPALALTQPGAYDDFCWWYLTTILGSGKVPPACLQPDMIAHLLEAAAEPDFLGLQTTRFLGLVWSNSEAYRKQFDLGNAIDRLLFVFDMTTTILPKTTQFLPFFRFLFDADGGSIFQRVLARLTANAPTHQAARVVSADSPQDILLVGHASKDSGLGRNFAMLSEALTMDGVKLSTMDYEWLAGMVHDELGRWRADCRSRPLVVFAVNAQDVPGFFVKDRSGILFECHTAGFFLWEVSRPARVQKLGATLVDEIWAPTRYVADVYAPLNRTHVVGKGLFHGDEAFLSQARAAANPAFRFVTVFDFDSSIERKNPLAVVEAFQQAFTAGEKVELIVKTSNVNPRHWSNSEKQWERLLKAAAGDARIQTVSTRLSNEDMTALIRDADCVVSLHRSEGFGYLMSDAMAYGTPVIATDYSGNADFCDAESSWPVPYRLIDASHSATRWFCEGAKWADADVGAAAQQMRHVHAHYDDAVRKAGRARAQIAERYSMDAFRSALRGRIAAIRTGA
jgi:glycosyltransferase involved in cell wall biosynthesis